MPGLIQILRENDLGFFNILSDNWDIEFNSHDVSSAIDFFLKALDDPLRFLQVKESLPNDAQNALSNLLSMEGRIPWVIFCRKYGDLRIMGPGRRDRERPDLHPISTTEVLWYRAMIGKAFMDDPKEPQEFAYIPDEFIKYLRNPIPNKDSNIRPPATKEEYINPIFASDLILDDLCTLLAAIRIGKNITKIDTSDWVTQPAMLTKILSINNFIDPDGKINPIQVGEFLESNRLIALSQIAQSWIQSNDINELLLLPDLIFEGEITNLPQQSREFLINIINQIPEGEWWSINGLVSQIKERFPDYQRPAGDYDSWFIRKKDSTKYLRGFSMWDEVDGQLIRFLLSGPLFWLGLVDLGYGFEKSQPLAFRKSIFYSQIFFNKNPEKYNQETDQVLIKSNGTIICHPLTARSLRYQIARFCEWEPKKANNFVYRITAKSIENAIRQGLKPGQIITLLKKHSLEQLPPGISNALDRWDKYGPQILMSKIILLRSSNPGILETILKSRAKRYVKEIISPEVFVIEDNHENIIHDVLLEAGYLLDDKRDV